jgi:hypothetical protein
MFVPDKRHEGDWWDMFSSFEFEKDIITSIANNRKK